MYEEDSDSEFVAHEECPECGSKDNLARYSDGHAYCFGCSYKERADGATRARVASRPRDFLDGEFKPLTARDINEETCKKFNYRVGFMGDKPVHIANVYTPDGQEIACQHIRTKDKQFPFIGSVKKAGMFGQHLWKNEGRMAVVTEGEIDCMTLSQIQDNRWPTMSILCGAAKPEHTSKITKYIARFISYLSGFDKVVFFFDSDEQGMASAQAAASMMPPGKGFTAFIPGYKDINEAHLAGQDELIKQCMWNAKEYKPESLVSIAEIWNELDTPPLLGLPWMFDELTAATFGRRAGEVYGFGGGTGCGKTDLFSQQMAYDVDVLGLPIGAIYLETPIIETARRIAGKIGHKQFHIPDGRWTDEEFASAKERLKDKAFFYRSAFGNGEWSDIAAFIRHCHHAHGVKLFYLDHLTALADPSHERESLETLMKEMAQLAQELQVIIHYVSHLSTPEGKPHEEGGRVMSKHFKGSRAIGYWSFFMFGIERDTQAEDPKERLTTTFRCLKDRYTGKATGLVLPLKYDPDTGVLAVSQDNPFEGDNAKDDLPF